MTPTLFDSNVFIALDRQFNLEDAVKTAREILKESRRLGYDPVTLSCVLDEIHRLPNPSELLKIAADHYPDIRILSTGSSTLGASARFRDTLAGRKQEVWLTPMKNTSRFPK